MNTKYNDTIDEFKKTEPAKLLMLKAFSEIKPAKGNRFGFFLSIILSVVFSTIIACSNDTVQLMIKVTNVLLNVQLAVFGCVFAVYSILLAFLSDSYMKRLSKITIPNKTSQLKKSIVYYEAILFLYFINIGITGVILLFCECIDPMFRLTSSILFDTIFAWGLLIVYFLFSFRVFYELKSIIYNTIVLFHASISYKFIDFSVEESDD